MNVNGVILQTLSQASVVCVQGVQEIFDLWKTKYFRTFKCTGRFRLSDIPFYQLCNGEVLFRHGAEDFNTN